MSVTVVIRDLTLPFFIGVLDQEREAAQTVVIGIEMRVTIPDRPSEASQDYVSYSPIVEYLMARSAGGRHIDLVEELADDIFRELFADARIESARVEILKPDIFADAAGVGVVIERENLNFTG